MQMLVSPCGLYLFSHSVMGRKKLQLLENVVFVSNLYLNFGFATYQLFHVG